MTVLSAQTIRRLGILTPLREEHRGPSGNSAGLSCCGYDLISDAIYCVRPRQFVLAASVELFNIPTFVVGVVHDKSSLARRGLAVQNTVLEPGWRGHVTLELTNHGTKNILICAGDPIAQVLFHRLDEPTEQPYRGRYQDQEAGPQEARLEEYCEQCHGPCLRRPRHGEFNV